MLIGSVRVEGEVVVTHNTSYALDNIAAISARRPLLAFGVMVMVGAAGLILSFGDLLYMTEIVVLGALGAAGMFVGLTFGQLKLHSLALKGNEVSDVLYGTYHRLNEVRAEIDERLRERRKGSV